MVTAEEQVAEFQTASGNVDPDMWLTLVKEESEEFLEAFTSFLKEHADFVYVVVGLYNVAEKPSEKYSDAFTENQKLAISLFKDLTEALDPIVNQAFNEVHSSNMSKFDENGKPYEVREDGKVLKGPHYRPADMLKVVKEAYRNA